MKACWYLCVGNIIWQKVRLLRYLLSQEAASGSVSQYHLGSCFAHIGHTVSLTPEHAVLPAKQLLQSTLG